MYKIGLLRFGYPATVLNIKVGCPNLQIDSMVSVLSERVC
jgi:hypothetical protein